ncbi:hypothetical protein ACM66B_004045 [Microbotryomycetes sp. NB124-2]
MAATVSTNTNPSAPLTRSRTNLFLSYRDSAIRPTTTTTAYDYGIDEDDYATESRGLLTDDTVLDMSGLGNGQATGSRRSSLRPATTSLPPRWMDVSDAVDDILAKVKPKMDRLDKLHAKHVLPGFKDRSAEEREIEALANEITNDFRATQKHIRKIADMSKQLLAASSKSHIRNPEATRLELIMAANVQTALATKVQELSGIFRKKQTAYLKQIRGHEGRSSVSVGTSETGRDPLAALADDEQYSIQSQRTAVASGLSIDVAQREQEILNIAQSITDLSDLFKDLSSLVIDQGTLLDRVDYNVEQMNVEVKKAVVELKTATTYQRRSGKCQLIFLLILLIVACLVIIAYKPSRTSSAPEVEQPTNQGMDQLGRRGAIVKGSPQDMDGVIARTTTSRNTASSCPAALVTAAAATLTIGTATLVGRGNPLRAFSSSQPLLCDEQRREQSSSSSGLLSSLSSSLPTISTDTFKIELPGLPSLPSFGSTVKSWTKSLSEWTDKLRLLQDELTGEKGSLISNVLDRGKDVKENPEIQWDAKVRLGNDLSMVERGFLRARREAVKPAFCRLTGLSEDEVHIDDIPLVAIAGSGGGYRAMINTLGSITQAKDSGIWDVVAYASAVSGSCWALSALYSVGQGDIKKTLEHIKARIETPFLDPESLSLLTTKPTSEYLLSGAILKQNSKAGEITIVDAYGTLVSGRLFVPSDLSRLSNRHLKLSSQRDYVDTGKYPMPIYCTIRHELPDTKAKEVEEKRVQSKEAKTASERADARQAKNELVKQGSWMWFEISPYEVGCDEAGAWIPTWSLGRLFDNGKSVERIPELSLSILSGIFASAFCATLYSYYNEIRPVLIAAPFASQIQQFAEENQAQLDSIHPFPPAELPNFLKGLNGQLRSEAPESLSKLDTLGFMDAGANLNIPYVPLFRRDCDLIIALDASADSQDIWFNRAAEYAEKAQVSARWPSVDYKSLFPKEEATAANNKSADGEKQNRASDAASKVDQAKAQEKNAAATTPAPRAEQPNNPQRPPVGSGPQSGDETNKTTNKDVVGSESKPVPKSQAREPPLEKCSIWIGSTKQEEGKSCRKDYPSVEDVAERDGIALAYIPLRGKLEREPDEDDDKKQGKDKVGKLELVDVADVWSTWRFEYKPRETDRLVELSRNNFKAGEEQIKTVIRGLYERKKRQRLQGQR